MARGREQKSHGEKTSLDQFIQGTQANELSGFPDFFIQAAIEAEKRSHCIVAFRAGQSPNVNKGFEISPKPMSIKTKTSTDSQGYPLLAGFIAVDGKTFGRKGSDTAGNVVEFNKHKLEAKGEEGRAEAEKYSAQQLQIKLSELERDLANNKYIELEAPTGYRRFQATQVEHGQFIDPNPQTRNDLIFQIKLSEEEKSDADPLYSVEYRHTEKDAFQPLQVVAYEGHPVTGDADMFSVLPSFQDMSILQEISDNRLHKPFDAAKPSDLIELATMYLIIKNEIDGAIIEQSDLGREKLEDFLAKHPELHKAGIMSPYELYVLMAVNMTVADCFVEKYPLGAEKLIRHGAESFNPGKPSDLNASIFHIWQGKTYLTENETDLAAFYLLPGVLEKNFLPIHPGWNMQIWGPVVAKQIELGQTNYISAETLESYRSYLELVKLKPTFEALDREQSEKLLSGKLYELEDKQVDHLYIQASHINLVEANLQLKEILDLPENTPLKNQALGLLNAMNAFNQMADNSLEIHRKPIGNIYPDHKPKSNFYPQPTFLRNLEINIQTKQSLEEQTMKLKNEYQKLHSATNQRGKISGLKEKVSLSLKNLFHVLPKTEEKSDKPIPENSSPKKKF